MTAIAKLDTTKRQTLLGKLGNKYTVDPNKLLDTLKVTAFNVRGQDVSDEQMVSLLVVADQYDLNPFTRELYAFPDRNGGIVPIVSIDGWLRIINERPECDGVEFVEGEADAHGLPTYIECVIYRKDRQYPTKVKEFMSEVNRGTPPWKSHPRRMLRHKALIQCARVAFGFAGIFDPDEGERIAEVDMGEAVVISPKRPGPATAASLEPEDTPERKTLVADLYTKADEGLEPLTQTWAALTEEQRAMVGPTEWERIKKRVPVEG